PYTKRGKVAGFRITRISPGSIYEKIGLQNGDVLLRVNTQNLDNPAKLFSLYKEMRNKRHISLLLSRNGQDRTFQYDIR
ncbi:MAG TPA: PDZ domain-containing protein, partial [Nitrospirota bacterium]|nr:PDZ domain-containing protein [Nitrospirota bacterium]